MLGEEHQLHPRPYRESGRLASATGDLRKAIAGLQEVGLVGGHQRAVEGPSPPPCLKVAGEAGF